MSTAIAARAPGKAMLIGEYAVLDGAQAVVAAIDCYAVARLQLECEAPASPFIAAALTEARSELLRLGRPISANAGLPVVDTEAFSREGRKLGLGSSAAATVAAVGALFHAAGVDLTDAEHRAALHSAARRAHDAAQGVAGSGADVQAAVFGGMRTVQAGARSAETLQLPAPLELRLVATSQSASTAELVACYRAAGAGATPGRAAMAQASQRFVAACRAGAASAVLEAIAEAEAAFLALGRALGRDLCTAEHRLIAEAARRAGGVAKPSGAGGGDLAVAFLPDARAADALAQDLSARAEDPQSPYARVALLPLRISSQGVQIFRLEKS